MKLKSGTGLLLVHNVRIFLVGLLRKKLVISTITEMGGFDDRVLSSSCNFVFDVKLGKRITIMVANCGSQSRQSELLNKPSCRD